MDAFARLNESYSKLPAPGPAWRARQQKRRDRYGSRHRL